MIYVLSGGGNPFNFEVVNTTTEPANPKENTIWVETSNALNCWTFGAEKPLRSSKTKNFVTYPYANASVTSAGVTYTDLGDGNITANGTATGSSYFRAARANADEGMFLLPAGTYTISGCPAGGSESTYMLQLVTLTDALETATIYNEVGDGKTVTLEKDTLCRMNFYAKKGATVNNLNVYFQVERGSTRTSFEKGNANGQIWLKTSSDGVISINALKRDSKRNSIALILSECYLFRTGYGWQNYSSATNDKTHIYQNGEWVSLAPAAPVEPDEPEWDGYYFKAGDQREDITGGWTTEGWTSTAYSLTGNAAINDDHLYVQTWGGCICQLGTVNKVDLTGISTLNASVTIQTAGDVVVCVSSAKSHVGSAASKLYSAKGTYTYSVDVSSLSGSYYIIVYALSTGGSTPDAKIANVWGE